MNKSVVYGLLLLIVLAGISIRIRLAQDKVLHHWDEKFHALVAKHCMDEPLRPKLYTTALLPYDYKNWYNNHIWLHKQPLPLWLMAISMKAFGVNEFSVRLPSLVLSAVLIVLLYFFASAWLSKPTALLACFFLSVNGLFIELGAGRVATDHYDVLFAAFIFIALFFAQKQAGGTNFLYAIFSGAFIGFALLTKWLPALVVLPLHFLFMLHYKHTWLSALKAVCTSGFVATSIALPWQLYILHEFPQEAKWEYMHNLLHFTTELEGHTNPGLFYYLNHIRINYSEIIYLPLIYLVYSLIKDKKQRYLHLALLVWILVPLLFFSLAQTKMQGYILFVAPALFIITAQFFAHLKLHLRSQNKLLYKIAGNLLLLAIVVLPLRYCYERTQFGFGAPEQDAERSNYKLLIGKYPSNTVLLNCKWPIECMFYTNYSAYSKKQLSAQEETILREKGYLPLYLNDAGSAATTH